MDSRFAFKINQPTYGKGEYNIEFGGFEVRDFLSPAYPQGIEGNLNVEVVEMYGLAINFARILIGQKDFVLTESFGKILLFGNTRNVFCGHIPELPTLHAKIIIDSRTVKFLAGGSRSFFILMEGSPVATALVPRFSEQPDALCEVYFCQKLTPVS